MIKNLFLVIEALTIRFFALLDATGLVRRAYLIATFAMTWSVLVWSMRYAELNAARPGIDTAAVIAAVGAVVGAVQAFAFKQYTDSRSSAPPPPPPMSVTLSATAESAPTPPQSQSGDTLKGTTCR